MKRAEIVDVIRKLRDELMAGFPCNRVYRDELRANAQAAINTLDSASTALPPNPDVRSIVRAFLDAEGYDGLYFSCVGVDYCGCHKDDLVPCETDPSVCQAGYLQHHTVDSGAMCEGRDCRCIGPNKGDKTDENA